MKDWKLRFHLSDVFFAFTIAAVLLWSCLWSMWDQRERIYLGIWEVTLWLGLVSGKGLWHSTRIAFAQGIAIGCAAVVDFLCFDPAPTATNDPFVLYLGASSLIVLGGISLTGLTMEYADQLTSCFQRFPWLRCGDPRRWKTRLVSVCVSCAFAGIALNVFWLNSSAAGKGALIAIVGLVVTGTLAGAGAMIALNVAMESGKRLSLLWGTNAGTRRQRVVAVGLAIIIVFACSLAYQRSRPTAWKTRWVDGSSLEIAISPDGKLLAVGSPPGWNAGFLNVPAGTITTFEWSTLSAISNCSSTSEFDSIRFLDRGQKLFFAESNVRRGNISRLVITETASGRRIQELKPPAATLRHVRVSTAGDECWTIETPKEGGPAQVSVWRTSDWQLAKTYPLDLEVKRHDLWFDWSPDSGTFISIDSGSGIPEVVNVVSKKIETTLASPESGRLGRISPNGQWYAAGQFMWNVATGARYTISCDPLFFPTFSADGKYVFVWETFDLTHSAGFQSVRSVPLLRHLPVTGLSRLLLYEVSTQRLVSKSPWIRGRGELQAASDNGRHVVVCYGDEYLGKYVTILWEPS